MKATVEVRGIGPVRVWCAASRGGLMITRYISTVDNKEAKGWALTHGRSGWAIDGNGGPRSLANARALMRALLLESIDWTADALKIRSSLTKREREWLRALTELR